MGSLADELAEVRREKVPGCVLMQRVDEARLKENLDADDVQALVAACGDLDYSARALMEVFNRLGIKVGRPSIGTHRGHGDCR